MKSAIVGLLLALWVVGGSAADVSTLRWDDLKTNDTVVPYKPGEQVLFCHAYTGSPNCVLASRLPTNIPCLSIHSRDPNGPWIDLGSVPGVQAVQGDGTITCHGYVVPRGQWWGINPAYKDR